MLRSRKSRLDRNHSSIRYSYCLAPPTNYILTLIKPFSFVWYVMPLLKTGALASTHDLFLWVYNEITQNKSTYAWLIASICRITCLMAASSGFYQSPGPPPLGNAWCMVLAHCHSHQTCQHSWSIFLLSCCLLLPWRPLGQYGASSCSMVVSSGFPGSPRHAALGDAICIALVHRRDHQNGQQRRCICL